jgi:Flp pilus assembly protein TadG
MRLRRCHRRAATIVQFAVVAPVTFLLLLGLLIGGLGIFRYQEVAYLAREASRWASVRGAQYATDTKNTAASASDVYNQVISPQAKGLNLSKLTYSVTWSTDNNQFHTKTVNNVVVKIANTVTVTVNYNWVPEAFLGGMTLSSTSVATMSY